MTSETCPIRVPRTRGKEIAALTVVCDSDPNRNVYDTNPSGGFGAHYGGVTLARLREIHGGDEFVRVSPVTGREHRISLRPYADLDPQRTYIEIDFHFYPAPYRSKEAQLIRERTIREIRRTLDGAIDWFDGTLQKREIEEGLAEKDRTPYDINPGMVDYSIRQFESFVQLAISTGVLTHAETWAIRREYVEARPDVFQRKEAWLIRPA